MSQNSQGLPRLVALTGRIGSGKTTTAQCLNRMYGYQQTRFAEALKNMLTAMLSSAGLSEDLAARFVDGDLKESPSSVLQGRTPRYAMQTLGTEWGRQLLGDNLWTNIWRCRAERIMRGGGLVVVDDCRYLNELALVYELNGTVLRVVNTSQAQTLDQATHSSENGNLGYDAIIEHDGINLDSLKRAISRHLG